MLPEDTAAWSAFPSVRPQVFDSKSEAANMYVVLTRSAGDLKNANTITLNCLSTSRNTQDVPATPNYSSHRRELAPA
jgi:hypothetical protein